MLIILYSALFVAGWIFVNNNHKFSFNTIEFWKKWPLLLSNLAGKGDCYFKLAVTTFSVLCLEKLRLWTIKHQKSNTKQHWAHISLKLTCNIPNIFVVVRHFCCMPTVNHLWIWCSLNISIVLFYNTWSLIPPGNGVTVSLTYWYMEFIKPWTAKSNIILYYIIYKFINNK